MESYMNKSNKLNPAESELITEGELDQILAYATQAGIGECEVNCLKSGDKILITLQELKEIVELALNSKHKEKT